MLYFNIDRWLGCLKQYLIIKPFYVESEIFLRSYLIDLARFSTILCSSAISSSFGLFPFSRADIVCTKLMRTSVSSEFCVTEMIEFDIPSFGGELDVETVVLPWLGISLLL